MSTPSALLWTLVTTAGIWAASNDAWGGNVSSSSLPVIVIDARGQSITNNVRVPADISVTGAAAGYIGKAAIAVRGSSSQFHPKKPYRIELQDAKGDDLKVPLLGLPKESDWILYPAYTDKTMVRDVVAYDLWREMGHYAPRTAYVELFFVENSKATNGQPAAATAQAPTKTGQRFTNYHGVYVLMEKIKRGKDRLDIAKLKRKDASEPEVSGGYIFKKDRLNKGEKGFKSAQGLEFAFEEPKEDEITPAQAQYLTNYVREFERVLFSDNFRDPTNGYRKYIDVDSFVDYHWILEATRNIDGYWFSQFFYKVWRVELCRGT